MANEKWDRDSLGARVNSQAFNELSMEHRSVLTDASTVDPDRLDQTLLAEARRQLQENKERIEKENKK